MAWSLRQGGRGVVSMDDPFTPSRELSAGRKQKTGVKRGAIGLSPLVPTRPPRRLCTTPAILGDCPPAPGVTSQREGPKPAVASSEERDLSGYKVTK